ncbi:MAG: hypothetical protein OCD03_03170 [Hyphomicrobiales bacterium]
MLVGPFKKIIATPENVEQSMRFIAGYIHVCKNAERKERYKIILFDLEKERVKLIAKIKEEKNREKILEELISKHSIQISKN